jgi:hypothetical protein
MLFSVRKPSGGPTSTVAASPPSQQPQTGLNNISPPQIVHPPHLYTTHSAQSAHPAQAYHHSSETATYVNIVGPSSISSRAPPPFYHHPPPLIRPQVQPHPGSSGHVPYSPAFQHHQHHVRPVGIAMPRQGNNEGTFQRQSSIGN